jgi:hypothetical protein
MCLEQKINKLVKKIRSRRGSPKRTFVAGHFYWFFYSKIQIGFKLILMQLLMRRGEYFSIVFNEG